MNFFGLFKRESLLLDDKGSKKISSEFDIASKSLIDTSKELLEVLERDGEVLKAKAKLLEEAGFTNSQLVRDLKEIESKKAKQKQIADRLQKAKDAFPNNKFIPEADLLAILKKHNMIIGNISDFNAYVPEENLLEIKAFYNNYSAETMKYYKKNRVDIYSHSSPRSYKEEITYKDYLAFKAHNDSLNDYPFSTSVEGYTKITRQYKEPDYYLFEEKVQLKICAFTHELQKENTVIKISSEPIVLLETTEFSGYNEKGYIVITAWGDDLKYEPALYIEPKEN